MELIFFFDEFVVEMFLEYKTYFLSRKSTGGISVLQGLGVVPRASGVLVGQGSEIVEMRCIFFLGQEDERLYRP